ncbi:MAG: hypothetical protein ABR78_00865 [Acidimicrobiia bacterium BACL6 MAG-120910-bin40]|nr:MAG: hypothetical protein ABR78_00865 [Acidimicrobiia bacterium BACL6 MAG-120910-bin40]
MLQDPSLDGRFGEFGGRFVPETLVPACQELEAAFRDAWADPLFRKELDDLLRDYAGRPSILTECHNLGKQLGIRLLLKREDLNHTGSHKINSVLGRYCWQNVWARSTLWPRLEPVNTVLHLQLLLLCLA